MAHCVYPPAGTPPAGAAPCADSETWAADNLKPEDVPLDELKTAAEKAMSSSDRLPCICPESRTIDSVLARQFFVADGLLAGAIQTAAIRPVTSVNTELEIAGASSTPLVRTAASTCLYHRVQLWHTQWPWGCWAGTVRALFLQRMHALLTGTLPGDWAGSQVLVNVRHALAGSETRNSVSCSWHRLAVTDAAACIAGIPSCTLLLQRPVTSCMMQAGPHCNGPGGP